MHIFLPYLRLREPIGSNLGMSQDLRFRGPITFGYAGLQPPGPLIEFHTDIVEDR